MDGNMYTNNSSTFATAHRNCESGCAYHGITDSVTNTLMKVQHVAVSENSVTTTVFRVR